PLPQGRIDRRCLRVRQRHATAPRGRHTATAAAGRRLRPSEPRADPVIPRGSRSACPWCPSGGLAARDEPRAALREWIRVASSARCERRSTPYASTVTVCLASIAATVARRSWRRYRDSRSAIAHAKSGCQPRRLSLSEVWGRRAEQLQADGVPADTEGGTHRL